MSRQLEGGPGTRPCGDLRATVTFAEGLRLWRACVPGPRGPNISVTIWLLAKSKLRSPRATEALDGCVAKGGSGAQGPGRQGPPACVSRCPPEAPLAVRLRLPHGTWLRGVHGETEATARVSSAFPFRLLQK